MKKTLAHFRHADRQTIAKLDGLKHIMRVTFPRKVEWWLVLSARGEVRGDSDAMCVLLKKSPKWEIIKNVEARILLECSDRLCR